MQRAVPLVILLFSLSACSGSRRDLTVEVRIPDPNGVETPIPGTFVVALPYDRDSILRGLEARAPEARPHTQALDSLFQAFRGPFRAFAQLSWRHDRLRRVRDSLAGAGAAGRTSLEDSLAQVGLELEQARRVLDSVRRSAWGRMDTMRLDVRRWEERVYAGYDTMVLTLARDRMREGIADTTNAVGLATFQLSRGAWWIHARAPDPEDPNAEWYWNIPVRAEDTVRLTPATGTRRPRY